MGSRRKPTEGRRQAQLAPPPERAQAERRRVVAVVAAAAIVLAASVAIVAAVVAGRGDNKTKAGGPGLTHVHGLGVNPKDGSLYIATHTGLFTAAEGQTKARRVGDSEQDVMGFSVLGPNTFLGSGHPGSLQGGPSNLGLIRSDNAGGSWKSVSLVGEADFHVLRSKDNTIYGFNASSGTLMVSNDNGRNWSDREPPGAMIDLAIDPRDPGHVVASTERGLVDSTTGGRRWRTLVDGKLALLTWPEPDQLYSVDGRGQVELSRDNGRRWEQRGSIGAQPAAFASGGGEVYAALPDGTVKRSTDGGSVWSIRARP